jgi:hypothetical protein
MGESKTHKPDFRVIPRNEETNKLEIKEVELAVPKWGWEYLQLRANALYDGDLNIAINEVFSAGLMAYIEIGEVNMEPANTMPC